MRKFSIFPLRFRPAGDSALYNARIAEINRVQAFYAGLLLLVFSIIEGAYAELIAHIRYEWFFWVVSVFLAAGVFLARRAGPAVYLGEALIFVMADAWMFYIMLDPEQTSGLLLASFTIGMFILTLFRYMPPLESLFFNLSIFLPFVFALIHIGFDNDIFRSSLFVLCGAFISQMRSYRGVCAEIRNSQLVAELESKSRRLTRLSSIDAMTDLLNRRSFETTYEDWIQDPSVTSLSLILYDIDQFKHYNDTYGHPAGDECIRKVVSAVGDALGNNCLAFRMGGEEFAVMAKCHLADAKVIAERILTNVRTQCPVSISIGVASQTRRSHRLEALYSAADQALYNAKANGRNRIESAEHEIDG